MIKAKQLDEIIATAIIRDMFTPQELPVNDELWQRYLHTAVAIRTAIHPLAAIVPRHATIKLELIMIEMLQYEYEDMRNLYNAAIAAGDLTRDSDSVTLQESTVK